MRRNRNHRPRVIVWIVIVSTTVTVMLIVIATLMRMRLRKSHETFDISSQAGTVLSTKGISGLLPVYPPCIVYPSDGSLVEFDTLTSVPGVRNACYFVDDGNSLIAEAAGGCSKTNHRLNLLDETPLYDGSLPPPKYTGPLPFKEVGVSTVVPGIDACKVIFDENVKSRDTALYERSLSDQAVRVTPEFQNLARLYNEKGDSMKSTNHAFAVCTKARSILAAKKESLNKELEKCRTIKADLSNQLANCYTELYKSPCRKQCKVMMWTDPNWKGIYSAQTFELPGGLVPSMRNDKYWRPQADKASALKLQSINGATCKLYTFYDTNGKGKSTEWVASNNETLKVPKLENVSNMDDEISSFRVMVI